MPESEEDKLKALNRAVVASLIAFWRDNGDFMGRFWNTDVFTHHQDGGWRRSAWQATKV